MRKQMNELRFLVCGALIVCAALFVIAPAAQAGNIIDPGDNHYAVPNASFGCGATSCSPTTPPIPADFFGPGSDPFEGQIYCQGDSANNGFDTIIRRTASGSVPPPYPVTPPPIPIEIVELSLISTAPIIVTYNGGLNPESWDVEVDLSSSPISPAQTGTMTVTKTHANGGVFRTEINVQPRFTFIRQSDSLTCVFDTGIEGIAPTQYNDAAPYPWVAPPVGNGFNPSGNYPLGLSRVGGSSGGCTLALVPKNFLIKFQQLPLNGPQYFGHDELSTAYVDTDINTHFTGCYMADDFADLVDTPVIKIKWWGSYLENEIMEPITRFLIAFEGDIPAVGQPGDAGHVASHPDQVILSQFVHLAAATPLNPGEYSETLLNSGGAPCNEALYEYEAVLENPFPQDPNTVYWVKIVAMVDDYAAWGRLLPAVQDSGFTLCGFLNLPYSIQSGYGLLVPVTRWGWHNRDYTIMDPYASTPPAVNPGENKQGPLSNGNDVWHFQDDAVSGDVYIDATDEVEIIVDQPTWMEEYYKYSLLYCTGQGGVDGPTDIVQYSKDLAFELWTIEEEPPEELDFGDAPDGAAVPGYPTLLAHPLIGASHIIVAGAPWLGDATDGPDAESDGQPNVTATGDDIDLASPSGGDDEDGVTLVPLVIGVAVPVTFEVNGGGGDVSAWIDFNGDGDWLDAGEEILSGVSYAPGVQVIMITAPASSTVGTTYVRFRITTAGYVPSYGPADDGEVEDHEVTIEEVVEDIPLMPKFRQLPQNGPDYFGHDELSTMYMSFTGTVEQPIESGYVGCYMADDFADNRDTPVIRLKWWGSYMEEVYEQPIDRFLIVFETDVPADTDLPYSHPGTVLLSQEVTRSNALGSPIIPLSPGQFSEDMISGGGSPCDESLYEYEAYLAIPFDQEAHTVYWVKIVAIVEPNPLDNYNPPDWWALEAAASQFTGGLCELLNKPWSDILEMTGISVTRWGWHNRDYTVRNPYASKKVTPGEFLDGTIMDPTNGTDLEIWHFQDDAVWGDIMADMVEEEWTVDQPTFYEAYYAWTWPLCGIDSTDVDGPDGIQDHSKDLAFELLTTECFDSTHPDYSAWLAAGRPECWCYMHQCQGDIAGDRDGSSKGGYYYVGPTDLNIMGVAWLVTEPPAGPGIASITDGICADLARDRDGSSKGGYYYVGPTDLNIMGANWLLLEVPAGPGLPINTCGGTLSP